MTHLLIWATGSREHQQLRFFLGDRQGEGIDALRDAVGGQPATAELLIGAESVLSTSVSLPARSRRQLMKALPFAVEERLAVDLDAVHIAFGRVEPGKSVDARVTDLATLRATLDVLRAEGIRITACHCDCDWLPDDADVSVLFTSDRVLLRERSGKGIAVAPDQWLVAATLMCRQLRKENGDQPLEVALWLAEADLAPSRLDMTALEAEAGSGAGPVVRQTVVDDLSTFLRSTDRRRAVDMLQGEFALRSDTVKYWRVVRPVAIAAGVWLTMQLGLDAARAVWVEQQTQQVRTDMVALYKSIFPAENTVPDPVRQFRTHLGGGGASGVGMRPMMQGLALSLPSLGAFQLETLAYQRERDELTVQVLAPNITSLDQFKTKLAEYRLNGEVSSAEQVGQQVRARVSVRGG